MERSDACVVGAGVVGLAVAVSLASRGLEVMLLDRAAVVGTGISSRNSEVVHAGIYYPPDSLKARLCVEGRHRLYAFCEQHGVPHRRLGKLIVATDADEEPMLEDIRRRAVASGVSDLEYWDAARVAGEEPLLRCSLALFSPSSGIVGAHDLMTALLGRLQASGGWFAPCSELVGAVPTGQGGWRLAVADPQDGVFEFEAGLLVNAAGLGAQQVAARIDGLDPQHVPPLYLCKGNYFAHAGRPPFRRLVYPLPERSGAGLGVHATLDLDGQVRFGPDVEWVGKEDYRVSEGRLPDYYQAVRRYFPGLADGALRAGYVGIRPKLQAPGEPARDFLILGPAELQMENLVLLFGIESPGLTASLAIGEHVAALLLDGAAAGAATGGAGG